MIIIIMIMMQLIYFQSIARVVNEYFNNLMESHSHIKLHFHADNLLKKKQQIQQILTKTRTKMKMK